MNRYTNVYPLSKLYILFDIFFFHFFVFLERLEGDIRSHRAFHLFYTIFSHDVFCTCHNLLGASLNMNSWFYTCISLIRFFIFEIVFEKYYLIRPCGWPLSINRNCPVEKDRTTYRKTKYEGMYMFILIFLQTCINHVIQVKRNLIHFSFFLQRSYEHYVFKDQWVLPMENCLN